MSAVGRSQFSRENSKTSTSASYANVLLIGVKNTYPGKGEMMKGWLKAERFNLNLVQYGKIFLKSSFLVIGGFFARRNIFFAAKTSFS